MKWFCKHDWGAWGKVIPSYDAYVSQQFRKCKKCGIIKKRTLSHKNIAVHKINDSVEDKENNNDTANISDTTSI